MSRWVPLPITITSRLEIADLSPAARCVWMALRVAHGLHGMAGVVPASIASARGLPLAVPALVAGLDVADALAELGGAGLIRPHDDGLALADWDVDAEEAKCTSCHCRNPDPRSTRCPVCKSRDTDPTRRSSRRRNGAEMAQTKRRAKNGNQPQLSQGLADHGAEMAQTRRSDGAAMAQPRPDPTLQSTRFTGALARLPEAPAEPAGETELQAPPAASSSQQQPPPAAVPTVPDDGGRRDAERSPEPAPAAPTGPPPEPGPIVEGWLLELRERNVERLAPGQVADLLGRLDAPGTARGPGLLRERLQFGARVVAWCPSPEQLARWLQRVRRWFRAVNVGAYLRRAVARGGDFGTVLGSHARNRFGRAAETWRDFAPSTERALEGPHAADVARIVAGVAAVAVAVDEGERERLRAELRRMLQHRRPVAARQVLLRLVGSDHSDVAVGRAIGDACTLDAARQLLRGAA